MSDDFYKVVTSRYFGDRDRLFSGFETELENERWWLPCGELKQTMAKLQLFNFDNELTGRVCLRRRFRGTKRQKEDGIDRLDCSNRR